MNYKQFLTIRLSWLWCAVIFLCSSGCLTPFNTKTPQVVHRPAELERREAQIHDPYPDATFGPDTGFRPLGFTEQRSEAQRAKDRFYTAMLRRQNGSPLTPQSFNPHSRRPQVSNPNQYGTQQVYGAQPNVVPTNYSVNGNPNPIPGSAVPVASAQQISNGVAPVSPPVYYPPSYR